MLTEGVRRTELVQQQKQTTDLPVDVIAQPFVRVGAAEGGPRVDRGADRAGYDPAVHPHQFRHTFAHDWLDGGGAEGELMGWADRSMLDRDGADLQVQRAV
jgi:site-specific recombinase XerD